jgi:DNA polymerase III epsilon subunit-like protein
MTQTQNDTVAAAKHLLPIVLTDREAKAVRFALEDIDEARRDALGGAVENFGSIEALEERFKPGTFGAHEATDRAFLVCEIWQSNVQNHPSVFMDPEAYRLATLAWALMFDLYQLVACKQEEPHDRRRTH